MYQIKIDNKTFDRIPSSMDEVSFSRFLKYLAIDYNDVTETLYWALDCRPTFTNSPQVAKQIAKTIQTIQPVVDELHWFAESYQENETPAAVEIFEKQIPLSPGLVNELPYWSYVVAKHILKEERQREPYNPILRLPQLVAHYLYNRITGNPYDEAIAEQFAARVTEKNAVACLELGTYLIKETERLYLVELRELSGPVDEKVIEAGVEIFEKYGDVNNLDTLSMGDVTKWNKIKAIDRGTIYTKLMKLKDTSIFQKAYTEVLNREAKRSVGR